MSLQDELKSALNMMKFSINHDHKFSNYKLAFLSGFLQASMIFVVESVNFMIILAAKEYSEIVMNFMAIAIISEFDDFFYRAIGDDPLKALLID